MRRGRGGSPHICKHNARMMFFASFKVVGFEGWPNILGGQLARLPGSEENGPPDPKRARTPGGQKHRRKLRKRWKKSSAPPPTTDPPPSALQRPLQGQRRPSLCLRPAPDSVAKAGVVESGDISEYIGLRRDALQVFRSLGLQRPYRLRVVFSHCPLQQFGLLCCFRLEALVLRELRASCRAIENKWTPNGLLGSESPL